MPTVPVNSRPRIADWIGPVVLAIFGVILTAWIWGRTGDILLDFGHELYVAWQLSRGKMLYRDVAYLFGPLPPYLNAMWMRIFGPRLGVLLWANTFLLAATTALLYRILKAASGNLVAFVGCAFFLVVFALAAPARITAYSFLTPYVHGMTVGLLLCLGVIECVDRVQRSGQARSAGIGGVLTGLAFLTKPEMFLACAATLGMGLAAVARTRPGIRWKRAILAAAFGTIAPPVIALSLIALASHHLPLWGLSFTWRIAGFHTAMNLRLYLDGMGLDDIPANLRTIAWFSAVHAIVLGPLVLLSLAIRHGGFVATASGTAAAAILFFVPHVASDRFWIDGFRPLILYDLAAVVVTGYRILRPPTDPRRAVLQWCLAVLSTVLLSKMVLNVRIYQYGFVLAVPCAMLLILALLCGLPTLIERAGGSSLVIRWGSVGLLAGLAVGDLAITRRVLSERTMSIPLFSGGSLLCRPVDAPSAQAVAFLNDLPPGATSLVIPQAAGIDFASGRSNSIPFNDLNPLCFTLYGEGNVLSAVRAHPPDCLVIVHIDLSAFGARSFGVDYGVKLFHWIQANYQYVGTFGQPGAERSVDVWLLR